MSFACSCGKFQTFISASKKSELVIKAKVLKHIYYNRQRQTISKDQVDETKFFGHSILVEIVEIIRGKENRRTFEIYGGSEWKYAPGCMTKIDRIETDKIYVFSLFQTSESKNSQPCEGNEDYSLYACQESYVEYIEESDSVKGVLKGRNLDKERTLAYDKLKRKIT